MTQVSPSRTIAIGDKEFVLDASFATLRSLQESFKKDVLHLLFAIPDMRLDEVVKVISLASGTAADEVGELILDAYGVTTAEYALLKTELVAWLHVALAPKQDREKKKAEMAALIERQKASRGTTTSDSASAS